MGVHFDAVRGRQRVADVDHRAPLGEPGAEIDILGQPVGQAVQALGYGFPGTACQRLGPRIDLDAGNDVAIRQHLGQPLAGRRLLAKGFVVQNDATDRLLNPRCGEKQFPVVAPVVRRGWHADAVKALLDRSRTLISSQNALAWRDQIPGSLAKPFEVHCPSSPAP